MAKHTRSRIWTVPVDIDGGRVPVSFARMSVADFLEWERRYLSYRNPVGDAAPGPLNENDAATIARGNETMDWIRDTLSKHVSLPEGELEIDSTQILTGAQIFEEYGTDLALLVRLLNHVWLHHRFSEETRKNFLSLFDSPTGSGAPAPAVVGEIPDRTAGSVESAGSAMSEGADLPAAQTEVPSGEMVA